MNAQDQELLMNGAARLHDAFAVQLLTSADWPLWDQFVSESPLGLVYHLSTWAKAIESAFPHIRAQVLAMRDRRTGAILAGLPVYTVRSWLLGNRLVSVPFASICDPLIRSSGDFSLLFAALRSLRERDRARGIEVRARRTLPWIHEPELRSTRLYTHHYLDLSEDENAIWLRLSRTAVRRMVNKARNNGVMIRPAGSDSDVKTFYEMLILTRRRLALPPIPFSFFTALYRHVDPQQRRMLLAEANGEPIGGVFGLRFRDTFILEYSGESPTGRNSGVSQLLYWEAIRHAIQDGCRIFSLGRTSDSNKGLLAYKRHWSTTEEALPLLLFPGSFSGHGGTTKSSRAYRVVQTLARHLPGPCYRWMGDFCYRHLG